MSLLAKTNFSAGPLANLLITDGYKANPDQILNSFQDIAAQAGIDFSGIFGGKASGIMDQLVGLAEGKMNFSPEGIMQRLVAGNGQLAGAFAQIDSAIKNGLSIPKGLVDKAQATINGIISTVSGANIGSLKGITDAINSITGSANPFSAVFQDIGGSVSLITSLVNDSAKLGMHGVFSKISETIANPEILLNSLKSIIPSAIANFDIKLLLDAANSSIGGAIGQLFPDVIDVLMKGFKIPKDIKGNEFVGFLSDLISGLEKIDSGWNEYSRDPVGAASINGKRFLDSKAMRDMLYARNTQIHPFTYTITIVLGVVTVTRSLNNSNDEFMVLACAYSKETVREALRRDFPNCIIKTDKLNPVDRPIDAYTYVNGNYLSN